MKKNITKLTSLALLMLSTQANAGFAVSSTVGSSDYELNFNNQYANGDTSVYGIEDTFLYRDITFDYSWDNHQVGIKLGGLANQDDIINEDRNIDTGIDGLDSLTTTTGGGSRDEKSIFYTYRFDNGLALTAGYYVSNFDVDTSTEETFSGGTLYSGRQNYDFENSGVFVGIAYGYSFSDRFGGYTRLGYQTSSFNKLTTYDDTFIDYSKTGDSPWVETSVNNIQASSSYKVSGDALVYGFGLFYAVTENIVASLNYDAKSFSYDTAKPKIIVDGTLLDNNDFTQNIDEKQNTISASIRYVF